ncbi:MAG: medium chain dehydrogenase/reductase family protein [Anaerolineales bacterium]
MRYRSVIATQRGGPEVLKVIENDLHPPNSDQVRIQVLSAPVSLPDVEARYGRSPFKLKTPFVPGYAVIGIVDAIGTNTKNVNVGDRVASLTVSGGYSEYCYLAENQLIPVPPGIDLVAAAPLILNYIVAYQTMHRSARVKQHDHVLIIGASGGIGTAFLQLGSLVDLKMYGLASKNKHQVLVDYGAIPIDYHTQDFVQVIRDAEPGGLDVVFDGIGGDYIQRSFPLLKRGGTYVGYANPLNFPRMIRFITRVALYHLLPNGRSAKYYGTGSSRLNRQPFMEDWAILFRLLAEGKINPIIAATYPLTEAALANQLLESGNVIGNIVLVRDR